MTTHVTVTHGRVTAAQSLVRLDARVAIAVLFGAAVLWVLAQSVFAPGPLVNTGGWRLAGRFLSGALRPELSPAMLALAGRAALVTVAFAVCGSALSLAIGSVTGLASSQVWWQMVWGDGRKTRRHLLPWSLVRFLLAVPRAVHEIVWGLFFISVFGLDPLSAILAIGIPFGLVTGKVFSEIIDETPQESLIALRRQGASTWTAFAYGLLPQAFPYLLAYGMYRLECAIRAATVLGLIGAGGLGYQIVLSLQSVRYGEVWVFLYSLVLLIGLADAWSSLLNRRLNVTVQAARARCLEGSLGPSTGDGRRVVRCSLLGFAVLVPACFFYLGSDLGRVIDAESGTRLLGVIRDALPPRLPPGQLRALVGLAIETLEMSVLAIGIAGVGGLLCAPFASANLALPGGFRQALHDGRPRPVLWRAAVLAGTRGVLLVSRAFSEALWALILLLVLFPGLLPGALALALYNTGVLGRLMAQVNENADQRALRALHAQGVSGVAAFVYGLLPRVAPNYVAYLLYRWEVCARTTVVVGVVGAGGLGRRLEEQLTSFDYPAVVATLMAYVGVTFAVDLISALVRRTLRPGWR